VCQRCQPISAKTISPSKRDVHKHVFGDNPADTRRHFVGDGGSDFFLGIIAIIKRPPCFGFSFCCSLGVLDEFVAIIVHSVCILLPLLIVVSQFPFFVALGPSVILEAQLNLHRYLFATASRATSAPLGKLRELRLNQQRI
jgi:hypothetical protein